MTKDAPAPEVQQSGDSETGCKATTSALGEQTALDLFKTADLKFDQTSSTASSWLNFVGFTNMDSLAKCGKIQDLMAPNSTGDRSDATVQLVADRSDNLKDADIPSQQAGEIYEKYGVEVKERTVNGKKEYVYKYKADGKDITAATSDATPEGMEKALKKIEQETLAQMRRLELEYGVKFPPPGTVIGRQLDNCTGEQGEEVKARLPTLGELAGVKEALEKSKPTNRPLEKNGSRLNIYFADKPWNPGANGEDAGHMFHTEVGGNPSIIVSPDARNEYDHTDKDLDSDLTPEERLQSVTFSSMFQHELGHHTHYNFDKELKIPDKYLPGLGMKRVPNLDAPGETRDAIETKDGKLFVYLSADGACGVEGTGRWYEVNKDGETIGKDGKVLDVNGDPRNLELLNSMTSEQLREQAQNPASSDYMVDGREIIAEAIKNFRRNPESRLELLKTNPLLYEIAQELDQKEIDRTYPGKGFVRRADGSIGPQRRR